MQYITKEHHRVPAIGFDDDVTSYMYAAFEIPEYLNDTKRHIYKTEPIIGNAGMPALSMRCFALRFVYRQGSSYTALPVPVSRR
jgi:hypothetical protein